MTAEEKEKIIDKWLPILNADYLHFDEDGLENARKYARIASIKEYGDMGIMMWATVRDIDNVLKTNSLLFYVKPEYRGTKLFLTMIKNLEIIAVKEGAKAIIIGSSASGYKEEKFNKIFAQFGYLPNGFIKRV